MSATLADAIAAVRERLLEYTAGAWQDAELIRWINEGCRDVTRRSECLFDEATIAITGGIQEYLLPTNMLRAYAVDYNRSGDSQRYPLEYIDFNAAPEVWGLNQTMYEGTPSIFTSWGTPPSAKLILYPTPASSGSVRVKFYRVSLDALTADATIDMPEGWFDVVYDYAEFRALRRDKDPLWTDAKQMYEANLDNLIGLTRRFTDASGQVTPMNPGFIPWLHGG